MKAHALAILSAIALLGAFGGTVQAQIAYDNGDLYPGQPDHGWSAYNGGFGYNNWTPLADGAGGGTYMEGVGVNTRQVEGNFSFGLYAGSGSYDISRALTSGLTTGEFSIITRFDIAGSGPNLVGLRSGNNTTSFASGELLAFGLVNNSQLSYTDASGLHTLSSGEARGSAWDWTIDFNAAAGTYSGSVVNLGGGYSGTFSGNLAASSTTVGSFAVINSSSGGNQNLSFDTPTFSVGPAPEPPAFSLVALGSLIMVLAFKWRAGRAGS